jgi:hypothetical protein
VKKVFGLAPAPPGQLHPAFGPRALGSAATPKYEQEKFLRFQATRRRTTTAIPSWGSIGSRIVIHQNVRLDLGIGGIESFFRISISLSIFSQ